MAVTNEGMRTRLNRKIATYCLLRGIKSSLKKKASKCVTRTSKWYITKNKQVREKLAQRTTILDKKLKGLPAGAEKDALEAEWSELTTQQIRRYMADIDWLRQLFRGFPRLSA